MLGTRIRQARQARKLSLSDVADRAEISVATLSRIERDKQGMELGMFLSLCKILNTPPHEMIGKDGSEAADPIAAKIARLDVKERTRLWKDLSAGVQTKRNERAKMKTLSIEVEELLAQLDYLRDQIEAMQKRVKAR